MKIFERYLRRTKLYKKKFGDPEGQELLKFLAEESGAYRPSFVQGDPYQTAFNEGKRQMYSHIIGIINQNEEIIRRALQHEQEEMQLKEMMLQERGYK